MVQRPCCRYQHVSEHRLKVLSVCQVQAQPFHRCINRLYSKTSLQGRDFFHCCLLYKSAVQAHFQCQNQDNSLGV